MNTLEDYITYLFEQEGSPIGRGIDLARLKYRLQQGTASNKEVSDYEEWSNTSVAPENTEL